MILDSCTIILLAKASVLEKASESYNIKITSPVQEEVLEGKKKMFPDALLLERLVNEKKIKIVEVPLEKMHKMMQDFNMDKGEASVIARGLQEKELVGTDNRQGRKAARVYGLDLIGSIEVIVSLQKKKKISREKALEALSILQKEGWFSSYLIEQAKGDVQ